jgi:hypothetical protein
MWDTDRPRDGHPHWEGLYACQESGPHEEPRFVIDFMLDWAWDDGRRPRKLPDLPHAPEIG